MEPIKGLHHVTALAGEPQANVDFYVTVLGLNLVKRTVNFDDPGTYHLYYGDDVGRPGTILTFFPWPGAPRGRRGTGQATGTAFAVPPGGSLDWWMERFAQHAVDFDSVEERFGGRVLPFYDPDGLKVELVEQEGVKDWTYWHEGTVPAAHAIRGFHGVTLTVAGFERTAELLTTMGFHLGGKEGNRNRYVSGHRERGAAIDLVCAPEIQPGVVAVGTVHHIAFRSVSDTDQLAWRERIARTGLDVTPVIDRQYFHSIYFRDPGGVLFEVATDPPGFTLDEKPGQLGSTLKLPPWLEPRRRRIESMLAPIRVPQPTRT